MPGQRKKGTKMLGLWVTKEERELIETEMKELGFDNMSDYVRHKMGMPPSPKGRPTDNGDNPVDK
tara:strand:- start:654 stop:848 length:195 start_codon:yes stop_codon:yes gene_type:complete